MNEIVHCQGIEFPNRPSDLLATAEEIEEAVESAKYGWTHTLRADPAALKVSYDILVHNHDWDEQSEIGAIETPEGILIFETPQKPHSIQKNLVEGTNSLRIFCDDPFSWHKKSNGTAVSPR